MDVKHCCDLNLHGTVDDKRDRVKVKSFIYYETDCKLQSYRIGFIIRHPA